MGRVRDIGWTAWGYRYARKRNLLLITGHHLLDTPLLDRISTMRASLVACAVGAAAQEQMHLSVTGHANEMALDFVAPANATDIAVTLVGRASAIPSDCVTATLNGYTAQFCTALFTSLTPATQYSYSVKSSKAASAVYTFTNAPARAPIFAVYADFGYGVSHHAQLCTPRNLRNSKPHKRATHRT